MCARAIRPQRHRNAASIPCVVPQAETMTTLQRATCESGSASRDSMDSRDFIGVPGHTACKRTCVATIYRLQVMRNSASFSEEALSRTSKRSALHAACPYAWKRGRRRMRQHDAANTRCLQRLAEDCLVQQTARLRTRVCSRLLLPLRW